MNTMHGRPLRFLAIVIGAWGAVRAAMLWPVDGPMVAPVVAPAIAQADPFTLADRDLLSAAQRPSMPPGRASPAKTAMPNHARVLPGPAADPGRVMLAALGLIRFGPAEAIHPAPIRPATYSIDPAFGRSPLDEAAPRLIGSAWLIARDGTGLGAGLSGGQLGGSQAGARLAYAIDRQRRVALFARFAAPLEGAGKEAAAGLEWRPTRLPVRVIAEHRFAIDGGGDADAIGVVGGVGPVPVAAGFRLDAYGQAGAIRRRAVTGFADGAVHLNRQVAARHGIDLDVGAGAWAGIQPGTARLDIGPSLGISVPVVDQRLRLTLDWRERIAGRARPGSGPALTLGVDF